MTLHYSEIAKISEELDFILKNALVNKIKKGFQKEIIIEFYKDGDHYYLTLSINPDLASMHLSPKEGLTFFDADQFVMVLRKYLNRTTLLKVEPLQGERAVILKFKNTCQLVAHLFARGGNLFLLSSDKKILSSFNPCEDKFYQLLKGQSEKEESKLKECGNKSYNELVYQQYHFEFEKRLKEFLLRKTQTKARKSLKSLKEKIKNLNQDYQKCLKAEDYFHFGSLIMAFHSQNKEKGHSVLKTNDFEGNEIQIPLDSKRTVLENGEAYFEKSRKLKKAVPILEKRILEGEEKLEVLEKSLNETDHLSLEELKKNIREEKKVKVHKTLKKSKILYYINPQGFRILVGRSSEENDQIYKISRGKDIWFHVRDYPGSHVLIWVENKAPDQQTIADAATLALLYSKLKKQGEGFIMYTARRNLSKLAGMPSGQVNVSRYKSIKARLDPERLNHLKKRD